MTVISFPWELHPAGPDYVKTEGTFAALADSLRVPLPTLRQIAWWKGAGSETDFVHKDTLARFAETAIARFG